MLSIHNVTSGQASTYYTHDSYYTRDQLRGRWTGKGAEFLGLDGDFTREDFENIIEGRDRSGAELIERGFQGKHQSGKDLTFIAPKSVSVLSEVLGDERVREAHDKAVSRALSYLEEHFSEARITVKGVTEKVKTGNLVAALFQHDTSRELDPQLHTHAVVMNMTMRVEGKWRALASDKKKGDLLYGNKMLMGQIYRNELASNLKDLGYDVISDSKGLFEIRGMDRAVLNEFSSRKEQIDDKVRALKESGLYKGVNEQKLREIAALGSRVAKKDVDMNMVRSSWQATLCTHLIEVRRP